VCYYRGAFVADLCVDSGTVDASPRSAVIIRLRRGGMHWTNIILVLHWWGIVRPL